MTKTRILHVITGLLGGGAEALLHDLVAADASDRYEHVVISMLDQGVIGPSIERLGIPVHTLEMRPGRPSVRGLLRFRRICRELRPSVIQAWMYHANLLAVFAPRTRDASLIWCLHAAQVDMSNYRQLSSVVRRAGAFLSRRPDAIVVNSDVTRSEHERLGYRPRRWAMIPNGFDVERFRPDPEAKAAVRAELRISGATPLIGLVARFDPMKDHSTFLDAAKLAVESGLGAHFLLAGQDADPDNASLMNMIAARGLRSVVHVLGYRTDVQRLTAALDIATSTSISESFSNTIAEAMSCGVPCVVTNVANLPGLVNGFGIVVPPRDSAAVTAGWQTLLALAPCAREELGTGARARITNEFGLERMLANYHRLYSDLRNTTTSPGMSSGLL